MAQRSMPKTRDVGKNIDSLGFHGFQQDTGRSVLTKYQDLFVGSRSHLDLLIYEALTFGLMNCPGMLGFFLRQKLYRLLFKKQGKGVVISAGVSLRHPGRISIGDGCVIDEQVRLSARGSGNAGIELGENVLIGRGSVLNVREGIIKIHDHSSIGSYCRVGNVKGQLEIGRYVLVGAYCYIGAANHRADRNDIPMVFQGPEIRGGVIISDDVWIGSHTLIKDGVKIGKGSIIGAHSFVNKNIPAYSIAFGCPAQVRKRRHPESR